MKFVVSERRLGFLTYVSKVLTTEGSLNLEGRRFKDQKVVYSGDVRSA